MLEQILDYVKSNYRHMLERIVPTTPVEITRAAAQASNVDFFILYSSFLSLDYGESISHAFHVHI